MVSHDPEIEKAFASVTKACLGKSLSNHEKYEKWLFMHTHKPVSQASAVSGTVMYVPAFPYYTEAGKRAITLEESVEEGKKMLDERALSSLSLANASKLLSPIKLYSPDVRFGTNIALEECGVYFWSSHCYRGTWIGHAKYCGYCFWPRNSEYCFGCDFAFSCKSCLKCYHSVELSRCFEVSHSNSSSDCLFCHNVENCENCMFCFNAKGLRYAIGNVVVGEAEYWRIKKIVLDDILRRLEKDKKLDWSIFSIGSSKKQK
ncbi:MAG: hypothetical protein M1530_04390 [Candidatus Marsarchaeota archaeon]|nr:hypothetical protein [Candidatus Marsarchaeota archaeon]